MKKLHYLFLFLLSISTMTYSSAYYSPTENRNGQKINDAPYQSYRSGTTFNMMDFSQIPEVHNYQEVETMFNLIRDNRFIVAKKSAFPDITPRRISWLDPRDGCYARAATAEYLLTKHGYPRLAKIFVFGGWATFHVALGVRVGQQVYVLDPALDSTNPTPIDKWIKLNNYSSMDEASGIICDSYTFDLFDSCHLPNTKSDQAGLEEIENQYLAEEEFYVVYKLGQKDPSGYLGNNPPWIHK